MSQKLAFLLALQVRELQRNRRWGKILPPVACLRVNYQQFTVLLIQIRIQQIRLLFVQTNLSLDINTPEYGTAIERATIYYGIIVETA